MSDSPEKKTNRLDLFIAYLGVLAPAGYLIGLSYYQGKLAAFGVSAAAFPLSVQDIYVSAYYAIGSSLLAVGSVVVDFIKLIFTWYSISFAVVCIGFSYFVIKKKGNESSSLTINLTSKFKSVISYLHWKNNDFTKAVGVTGLAFYSILSILYVLIFLVVFWYAIPSFAHNKGSEIGVQIRTDYLENGCHIKSKEFWGNCHALIDKDGKTIFKGVLVIHSKDHVAFFNENGSLAIKVPQGACIVKEAHNRNLTCNSG
ncbi:hypothetical protein AB4238_20495 [Shewanella sp. 10N.286.45.A1]|uniref:hypothetical protein n=1 Tax=Shewanella sp. 10N.286.45.A1 TaxID=3229694 RepID=UPI003550768A